jgi:hypothetical protein
MERVEKVNIMSQNGHIVVNSEHTDHYNIAVKDDATLVVAGICDGRPVTLGRYRDEKEAVSALGELYAALVGGQSGFDMPESLLFAEERRIRDARTKRKGGS